MRKIMLTVLLICFAAMLTADQPAKWTLNECIQTALEGNPEYQIAKKEAEKAKAEIWQAYSMILPSVDGQASMQHAWDIQQNTIPNFIKEMLPPDYPGVSDMPDFVQFAFGLENTFTYGAMLSQPLFLGGAGIAGIQLSYAAYNAKKADMELSRQNLIYRTTDAFYQCLLAYKMANVQQDALDQAQANLDIVRKKYDVGAASGFDKMRAEVDVANLKPVVISSRNQYQAALTNLKAVLGYDGENKIIPEGELVFTEDEYQDMDYGDILSMASQKRPEIISMAQQKRMAAKGVALARSEFLPKLIFTTDYSFLGMRNDYKFQQDELSKGFTSALSLQIPLFKGFKNCKQYQMARLDYKIALDGEQLLNDGIEAEVEISFNGFHEAREKYQAASESVALAEEALRLANLMYEEGASTQLDVLGSQLALTQAKLNAISSLYEYQMARYNLRRVTGTLEGIL